MNWTKAKPTKPGYYWYWDENSFRPEILEIDEYMEVVNADTTDPLNIYKGYWIAIEIPGIPDEAQ